MGYDNETPNFLYENEDEMMQKKAIKLTIN